MKEWILAIFIIVLFFTLLAVPFDSDSSMQANIKTTEGTAYKDFGVDRLQKLGGGLYYDQTTGIVYWWNGVLTIGSQTSTTPTPYYSENGKLYRYDPVSSTMEEVK